MRFPTIPLGLFAFCVAACLPHSARAVGGGDFNFRAGTRMLGMGEAGAAALQGPEAAFWNPAGLARPAGFGLLAGQTNDSDTLNGEALAGSYALASGHTVGLSALWQDVPGIEQRDGAGNLIGTFDANNLDLGLQYANSLLPRLSLGAGADYQSSSQAGWQESAVRGSLGAQLRLENVNIGLAATQLGASNVLLQPSAALFIPVNDSARLVLAGGVLLEDPDSRAGAGVEADLGDALAVRVGYEVPFTATPLAGVSGLTAGLSIKIAAVSLDYALMLQGDLGPMHRLQIGYDWQPPE